MHFVQKRNLCAMYGLKHGEFNFLGQIDKPIAFVSNDAFHIVHK